MDLPVYLGTVSARYLCPGENTTLKCDHEALRNGDKIEDVVWKVWKSYRGWTSVAVCNRSLVCMLNESEVTDGIKVLGITKGTLTIKRTTRNATTSHLDFKCEIHNGSHALKHHVKIKLAGECKSDFSCPRGFSGQKGKYLHILISKLFSCTVFEQFYFVI